MTDLERVAMLQLKLNFYQISSSGPLYQVQKLPSIEGAPVKWFQHCAICGESREIPDQHWITWRRNVNFLHDAGCIYGQLIEGFLAELHGKGLNID